MQQNLLRVLFITSTSVLLFTGCSKEKTPARNRPQTTINLPPRANAGSNQIIYLPTNSAKLSGSGRDLDGTIISYQWSKIKGPQSFTIVSPNSADTEVKDLEFGEYEFELTVTDNRGAIGISFVVIVVTDPNDASCRGCWDY